MKRKLFIYKIMFSCTVNDDCLVGRYNFNNFSVMKTNEEIYKVGDRVYDPFNGCGWGYSYRVRYHFNISN